MLTLSHGTLLAELGLDLGSPCRGQIRTLPLHFVYFAAQGVVLELPKFPEPPRHVAPVSLASFTCFLEAKVTDLLSCTPISPRAPKAELDPSENKKWAKGADATVVF